MTYDSPPTRRWRAQALAALAGLAVLGLLAGCAVPEPEPAEWTPLSDPDPAEVEAVVFLVGDAGEALPGRSPVMARLQAEVERWSADLARDSAVSVFYLGDVVYPYGVRPRGSPDFPRDSIRVAAQVEVVGGAASRGHGTRAVFLAGNHDWGQTVGPEGLERLRNLERLIQEMADGWDVAASLQPAAGQAGPTVVDVGTGARFLVLDTHWWLQNPGERRLERVATDIADAIRTAGDRDVAVVAHHPFQSAGVHGGPIPFWRGFGLLYLLRRSGALIQDLNATPYRDFRLGVREAFEATRPPLLWAGGHDHSLQVLRGTGPDRPAWSLVSGSASKLTGVAAMDQLVFGQERPGFMRLTFLADRSVQLHVYSAPEEHQHCRGPRSSLERCMTRGVAAFEVAYADRLR